MRFIHFLLALTFLLPICAFAQVQNLSIEHKSGFDGYYRAGAWVPIFVTVTNEPSPGQSINDLDEFDGQLMVIFEPMDENGSPVRFERTINVPPSSKKRYTVYTKVPQDLRSNPVLRLNRSNGKTEATYPLDLNPLDDESLLVVNITEGMNRPNLPMLRGGLDRTLNTKIAPIDLPEHWAAWDAAEIVVMEKWPATGVSQEAVKALHDWVTMGGTLVMLTGGNASTYVPPVAKELLPVELEEKSLYLVETLSGMEIKDKAPEKDAKQRVYVLADSRLARGSDALLELDGVPLVVRRKQGKGQVIAFAVDFQTASREVESLFFPAWHAISPVRNLASPDHAIPSTLQRFKSVTGRAARPPNHLLIILICLLYTAVVGPVNFGVLAKKKKLEWAWLTVPVIVIVFFILIYGLGRITKGNTNLLREFEVQSFQSASVEGSTFAVTSTFVSNAGNHYIRPLQEGRTIADPYQWQDQLDFQDRSIFNAIGGMGTAGGGALPLAGHAPLISYDNEKAQIYISSWPMGTFDARTFVGHGPVELPGALTANLYWERYGLYGTIANETKRDFSEGWLLVGEEILRVGPLKQGETFTMPESNVLLAFSQDKSLNLTPSNVRYGMAENSFRSKGFMNPKDAEEVNQSNFGEIMTTLMNPPVTGKLLPPQRGEIYFVGYQSGRTPDVITTITPDERSHAVVTMVRISPRVRPGRDFTVPPQHMKLRMHAYGTDNAAVNGIFQFNNSEHMEILDAAVVLSAELPFSEPGLEVTSFAFNIDFQKETDSQDFFVQVYSYGRRNWVDVPVETLIPNSDMALPINGRLYFRLVSTKAKENGSGDFFSRNEIRRIDVKMNGRVPL